jgi:hypothetical protein
MSFPNRPACGLWLVLDIGSLVIYGGPGGNRTPDQRLRSPLLYPLSYGPRGIETAEKLAVTIIARSAATP